MNKTIPSIFQSSAEKYKDRIAFNYFDGSWKAMTYGEFHELAINIASFLISNGIYKGYRVAIISENRHEWCASYMAILMCGGIAVPIDVQLGSDEIRNLLLDSETKTVLHTSKTEAIVLRAIEGTEIKSINFDTHLFPHSPTHPFPHSPIHPDDIASIIYTSGTTGKPRGVMLTHNNFCSDADAIIKAEVVMHSDNVLSILPLHHTYSFMCTFLVPVFIGASITFASGLKSSEIISAIRDRNVTIVVSVPRLLEMIRNGIVLNIKEKKHISKILPWLIRVCGMIRRKTYINIGKAVFMSVHKNFPMLRFFTSGGARLEPQIMEDMEALGFTILEGYGLTETSPVITFNPVRRRKPGSVGKPLPCVEIKIGEDGEIMVKGPMVMKGYYKNQTATEDVLKDGWLLTGDTGYMDVEGYLYITGRKKEVIVLSSGKNVYPEDVEKVYMSIPLIKELCITEKEGFLHAVIVPDFDYAKKTLTGNISEALKWKINEVSMKLPEYMRVKGYTLCMEPLPRTPLGKLRRFMVKDIVNARPRLTGDRVVDRSLLEDEVGRKVMESIMSLLKEGISICSSDNLEFDLGFDSLKRIEFVSSLESAFSINLPETFISEVQTVQDAVLKVKEHLGEKGAGEVRGASWKEILQKEPPPQEIKKVSLSFSIMDMAVMYALLIIQKIIFKLLFNLKIKGSENIPKQGPFIIAPNHASFLDGFVIAASVPFKTFKCLYFLGLKKYFEGRLKSWFARMSHIIPIDSETYLHKALQMSAYILRKKMCLCIFPEGGRSFDGQLMPFKKGIGVLALELGIPVVPAFIEGTFEALPRGRGFIKPAKIKVVFGRLVSPSLIETDKIPEGIDAYQFFADELRRRVISLSG